MSSNEDYEALLENFKWCAAVLNVVVQEQGGIIEIEKDVLEGMDLAKHAVQVRVEEDKYVIESVELENDNV